MQIASLINSTLPQSPDAIAGALRAWSKGQMLDATVLRVSSGQALLKVNGLEVLAQTRMPLIVGQALRLQVDKAGTQPQLRVLDGPGNRSGNAPANASGNGPANSSANGQTNSPANAAAGGSGAQRGALLQVLTQNPTPTQGQAQVQAQGQAQASAQAPLTAHAQARPVATTGAQHGAAGMSAEALAAALLRAALPRRQPMPQSLSTLARFVAAPNAPNAHPDLQRTRTMASALLQTLPRPEDAGNANQLRAMVQRSGLFHEADRAQYSKASQQLADDPAQALARQVALNPPAADMKSRLMAIAESLSGALRGGAETDQSNAGLAAALRGAVANIEANQVASVRGSEQNSGQGAVWRVDLPFADERGYQALQLRIEREPRGGADEAALPSWIAQLSVEPPGRAPLHARIALSGDTVYTTFSTEDETLSAQIGQGEAELRQLLEVVNLNLGGMSCQHTERVSDADEQLPRTALVSEHA